MTQLTLPFPLPTLYQSFGSGGCHTQALSKLGIAMLNLNGLGMNEYWSESSTGLIFREHFWITGGRVL